MQKLLIFISVFMINAVIFGQVPEKMSYQAIIRNTSDNVVSNQPVKMKISILKGNVSGASVYIEEQSKNTNFNGLVTLEIGTGTVISGNFSEINWSDDQYFIKTETDPTGGNNYSITGTSQLLSVPYSLHAKTAENLTGAITELDPIYTPSIAATIKNTDIENWNSKLSVESQTLSYDCNDNLILSSGNSLKIPGISAANSFSSAQIQAKLNAGMSICEIKAQSQCGLPDEAFYGLTYKGGLIFLIQNCSGYVAATEDQSTSATWWNGSPYFFGYGPNSFGSVAETSAIVTQSGSGTYAASICDKLILNGFSDWFLPGNLSLYHMEKNLGPSGKNIMKYGVYWSSWDQNNTNAGYIDFGLSPGSKNKGTNSRVRAVRKF